MARIEHFAVFGNDLERLRAFYVDVMGLRVVADNSQAPVRGYFLADDSGAMLEVIERPPGTVTGSTRYVCHAAFWVDDYVAARDRLAAQGASFEADTVIDTPAFRTAFCSDPEGNRVQIVWRQMPLV
jgi:glyoxylase I family protein